MADQFGMSFSSKSEPDFERAHDYLVAAAAHWQARSEDDGPECLLSIVDEYLPTNDACGDEVDFHLSQAIGDLDVLTLRLEQAKVIYEHTHPGSYYADEGTTLVATRTEADEHIIFTLAPNTEADASFEQLWLIGALGAAGLRRPAYSSL